MMKEIAYSLVRCTVVVFTLLLGVNALRAQVKVGDNPQTIDANSLLELESTDKGVLIPRMALNDLSLETPLADPVPEGMLIYSEGGSVANGFYYWTGSEWLGIANSKSVRNNYYLIRSANDFPAASGGIITLAANSVYEINGSITVTNKIDLNGSYLVGRNANADQLVYTGSAELFTGNKGGTLRILTLIAASGKLFNLDATSNPGQSLLVRDCIITGCSNIGNIKGYNIVFIDVNSYVGNTTGITYENINYLLLNNAAWFPNNMGTFETYAGNFNTIIKQGDLCNPWQQTVQPALIFRGS